MLKQVIRFRSVDFNPETEDVCPVDDSTCDVPEEVCIPAKEGDVVKFQVEKSKLLDLYDISDYKVGLTSCGKMVAEDVGTIEDGKNVILVTANIPSEFSDGCYEFTIYVEYTPVDCGQYAGCTLQDLIDNGVRLGDVLQCTLNDFLNGSFTMDKP